METNKTARIAESNEVDLSSYAVKKCAVYPQCQSLVESDERDGKYTPVLNQTITKRYVALALPA